MGTKSGRSHFSDVFPSRHCSLGVRVTPDAAGSKGTREKATWSQEPSWQLGGPRRPAQATEVLGKGTRKGGSDRPKQRSANSPRTRTKREPLSAEDRARDPREEEQAPVDGSCEGRAAESALTPPQKDPTSQGTMPQLPRDRGEDGDKDELGAGGEHSPAAKGPVRTSPPPRADLMPSTQESEAKRQQQPLEARREGAPRAWGSEKTQAGPQGVPRVRRRGVAPSSSGNAAGGAPSSSTGSMQTASEARAAHRKPKARRVQAGSLKPPRGRGLLGRASCPHATPEPSSLSEPARDPFAMVPQVPHRRPTSERGQTRVRAAGGKKGGKN